MTTPKPTDPFYEQNQIMLDLETLATVPQAIVVSVGLVRFDPGDLQNPIKDKHYAVLSINDQFENERVTSDATIEWWSTQSYEARQVLDEASKAEDEVHEQLLRISEFFGKNAVLWGNGADFDNVILADLYRTYELRQPWMHYRNRCFRTLKMLGEKRLSPAKLALGMPVREGVHHNALDDAVYQAKVAVQLLRAL